jgi:subtilase family serine protease
MPGERFMSNKSRRYACLLLPVALFSSLSYAVSPDRIPGAIDSSNMVELKNHVSPLARPQSDQGPVETSQIMHVTMMFVPTAQQEAALQTLLTEQQDRKSPQYHKWLTPAQYADRFGLSPNDISKISSWLQAQGFKVTYLANGRDFISFQGTAGQVESVFRTQIHNYNVKGKMHFANVTSPYIPAALSGIVAAFRGLHNFVPLPMLKQHPSYTYTDDGETFHAIAPGDTATIYDINPLYNASPAINGAGINVVIAGQTDIYLADINYFRGAFNITPQLTCTVNSSNEIQAGACSVGNFQEVWPDGDPGLSAGDISESDLDIETMSGVAPGAEIVFVTSPVNDGGVDTSVSYAVDQNPPLGKVISYSYGLCEPLVTASGIAASEEVYEKAGSEGISMFAASGDSASAICDAEIGSGNEPATFGASVSYPASSPNVTGVGGTEFDEDIGTGPYWSSTNGGNGGSAITYIPETAWNDTGTQLVGSQLDGSGGGASNCAFGSNVAIEDGFEYEICDQAPNGGFTKPTWQNGVTPSDSVRDVPDIAFSASNVNDPYIVCTPQSEVVNGSSSSTSTCVDGITNALIEYNSAFGGTSASTPVTAGMTALLNQYLGENGLGLINQQLYTLFGSNPTGVFHEINTGTNEVTGGSSTNKATCTPGDPTFETSTTVVCPSNGEIGFAVPGGHTYSQVNGVGSVDIDNFILAWAASITPTGNFTLGAAPTNPSVSAGKTTNAITITLTPTNGFTSTVTFSCPSSPSGVSCTFNPTSVTPTSSSPVTTDLTIQTDPQIATGTQTITVSGTGGGVTQTTNVSLNVTATTQTFTLTSQNATYSVTPGQSAAVNVTVCSTTGFVPTSSTCPAASGATTIVPVTYSCSGAPSESNCTTSSPTTNATSVSFQVTTTAATSELRSPFGRGSRLFYAALLPGMLGIMFRVGSRKRAPHLRGMRMLGLIVVLGFSTLWLGSCSGSNNNSSSNPGTPAGTYTLTINATTNGTNPVTSSTTFTLTVQ